jgi:hypothetical protein
LIVDRDPLYTAQFETLLASAGVAVIRLPARSPNLNAYAERFVRSIKEECLGHVIPLGKRHLRTILGELVDHYHTERNHQGLDSAIPFPDNASSSRTGRVRRCERLGGCSTSTSDRLHNARFLETLRDGAERSTVDRQYVAVRADGVAGGGDDLLRRREHRSRHAPRLTG